MVFFKRGFSEACWAARTGCIVGGGIVADFLFRIDQQVKVKATGEIGMVTYRDIERDNLMMEER